MALLHTHRGKMKRIAFQFTPYSWVRFEWRPASSLRRWLAVCGIILVVSEAWPALLPTLHPTPLRSHSDLPLVPASRAQHLLPQVCAVDATRALPGTVAPRLPGQRRRSGHAGDLRLHG